MDDIRVRERLTRELRLELAWLTSISGAGVESFDDIMRAVRKRRGELERLLEKYDR